MAKRLVCHAKCLTSSKLILESPSMSKSLSFDPNFASAAMHSLRSMKPEPFLSNSSNSRRRAVVSITLAGAERGLEGGCRRGECITFIHKTFAVSDLQNACETNEPSEPRQSQRFHRDKQLVTARSPHK